MSAKAKILSYLSQFDLKYEDEHFLLRLKHFFSYFYYQIKY